MGTFRTITQSGGSMLWQLSGENITNHEAFAFTLQNALPNVGALISDVTVFTNANFAANQPSYVIKLTVVDTSLNPSAETITGNFESNGV